MRKDVRCALGARGNPVLHAQGAGGEAHNDFRGVAVPMGAGLQLLIQEEFSISDTWHWRLPL